MAISKRIFSVVLAIAMVLSFVQIGASAIDISAGETITANQATMVDDGSGREVIPQATVTATEVIRVAASVGSMAKGSTIVPATPSGVPQITSTYAAEAYSGETPSYPTVIFKTDLSLANNKNVTIKFSNSSVTYTVTNPDSNTWIWTITGGTATAGSYIDYEIGYAYTYTDRLTGKSVTNTYVAYGSSYVEGIIQPAGMYIDSYRTKPWNHSGTDADFVYRILGLNTYGSYYDPGDGSAGSGDNFKKDSSVWAHGYFDFVSMTPVQWGWDANEAAGYGSVLWGVDNGDGNRYGNTSVDRQRAVSTTYIDSSRGTALNGANINLRYAVMDLRYGSKDDEYTRSISSFSVLPGESGFDSNYEDNATASTQLAPASMGSEVVFRDGNTIPSTPYRISNYALSVPFNGTTYKDAMATLADGTKEIKYTFISSLYGRYHASDRMIANHTAVHLHFIMYNKGDLRGLVQDALTYYVPDSPTGTKMGVMPQARYYSNGWENFKTALTAAQRTIAKPNLNQTDIDTAYANLDLAMKELVVAEADYTVITNAVTTLSGLNPAHYTDESWANVLVARNAVVEGYSTFYQNAVNKMGADLLAAIDALEYKPADYTYVDEAIEATKGFDTSVYTVESVKAMTDLVADAQDPAFRSKNITEQDVVDEMADRIYAAKNALAYKSADYSAVNAAVDRYNAINRSLYTEQSLNRVTSYYEQIMYGLNITAQPIVDEMAADLNYAIDKYLVYKQADYTAVDEAIEKYMDLDSKRYTSASWSNLEDAVYEAEDNYGLDIRYQSDVDALAAAIEEAIKNLQYTIGDYSKVDAALEQYEEYAKTTHLYTPESWADVEEAVDAVQYGLTADKQDEIDAFAKEINNAIAGLSYVGADYTEVDKAIARFNALDRTLYTSASYVKARQATLAVDRTLTADKQADVDAMAANINKAIDDLVYNTANYSAVDSAKASAQNYINLANEFAAAHKGYSYYTPESYKALTDAIAAVVTGLDVRYQAQVNNYAVAINAAISGLEENDADYSAVTAAQKKAAAINESLYTANSVAALKLAVNSVETGLYTDEQALVDGFAAGIEAAIKNLVYKPIDTTVYEAVKATIPADTSIYTPESVKAVTDAKATVDTFLSGNVNITNQASLNVLVSALDSAIKALELKAAPIDTTEYEAVKATIPADTSIYTTESVKAVTDANAAIEAFLAGDVDSTNQAELDALVDVLDAAIKNLALNAYFQANAETDCKIADGLITGLQTRLTLKLLQDTYLDYAGVTVTATNPTGGRFLGTGSVVTVTYPTGEVETYTIVIYGDMNGDGNVNTTDVTNLSLHISKSTAITAAQRKAMNLDGSRRVDTTDLSKLKLAIKNNTAINQANPAL